MPLVYKTWIGLPWKEILSKLGEAQVEEAILKPPFEAMAVGELRFVSFQEVGGKLRAYLTYDNYLSSERPPRSSEAFEKIKGL